MNAYGEDYIKAINMTKINLNIPIGNSGYQQRTFEVLACGGFLLKHSVALRIIIMVIFIHSLLTSIGAFNRGMIGDDVIFHIRVAEDLYDNGFSALVSDMMLSSQGLPYAPGIHLLLIAVSPFRESFILLLQFLMFPLIMWIFTYIAYEERGIKYAAFMILVLSSSIGFFDRMIQFIPQTFEVLFFGVAVYSFFRERFVLFGACVGIMLLFHAPVAILLASSFVLYFLIVKESSQDNDIVRFAHACSAFLLSVVPGVYYLGWIPSAFARHGSSLYRQKELFLENPLVFTNIYLGPLMLSGVCLLPMLRWSTMKRIDRLMFLTLIAMLPMAVFWPARVQTYIAIPLAFLIPAAAGKWNDYLWYVYLMVAIVMFVPKTMLMIA